MSGTVERGVYDGRSLHELSFLPRGQDCTEGESARIKRCLRAIEPELVETGAAGVASRLAVRWPCEWAEVCEEREMRGG